MLPRLYFIYPEILVYSENGDPKFPASNAGDEFLPWFVKPDRIVKDKLAQMGITLPYVMNHNTTPDVNEVLHQLAHNEADRYIDNTFKNIVGLTYEQAINTPEINTILPIVLFSDEYFYKKKITPLSDELQKRIQDGKLKVLFIVPTEGWFSTRYQHFHWLLEFGKVNNIPKESLIVLNPNFKSKSNYFNFLFNHGILDFMTVMEYDYFRYSLWFYQGIHMLERKDKIKVRDKFQEFKQEKLYRGFTKHFLCFNRAVRPHRIFMFSEIMSNPKLKDTTYLSMGHIDPRSIDFSKVILRDIAPTYKHSRTKLLNFLETYNQSQPLVFDIEDIASNNPADKLNEEAHISSFVNIVTETLHHEDALFFTEKIYKPIACAQPFVLVGSPFMLKKLQEFGFRTFSEFWDESYDEETDYTLRMEKIVDILEEIASWDLNKCREVYQQMDEILSHNIKILTSTRELEEVHGQLSNFPLAIK